MAARGLFGATIEPSQAVATVVTEVLGVWAGAIVLGAIIAAILSTADSLLIAGTAHLIHDIGEKSLGLSLSPEQQLLASRVSTVLIGVLALVLALGMQTIIELLLLSYTMYAAGVFIPVVLGLYWSGGTGPGAVAGIVVGAMVGAATSVGWLPVGGWPAIVVGALASLLAYWVVSVAKPDADRFASNKRKKSA
jgi:SSS family solute:Na+ symporter